MPRERERESAQLCTACIKERLAARLRERGKVRGVFLIFGLDEN
jgi:hypothetical protein